MKLKFWLYGSGQRHNEKIVSFPDNYSDSDIEFELDDWVRDLRCNSDYIRYGWEVCTEISE